MVKVASFILIVLACEALIVAAKSNDTCNDGCLVKTYEVSSNGSIGCGDDDCAVKASFGSDLIDGKLVFNIDITGYQAKYNDYFIVKLIHFDIVNQYECYRVESGTSAQVTIRETIFTSGSTRMQDGNLYCSWSMTKDNDIWPVYSKYSEDKFPLTFWEDLKIAVEFQGKYKPIVVASNTMELPIYQGQFLRCCNEVHGYSQDVLIVNQTKDRNEFIMQTFDSPKLYTALLTDTDGNKLEFSCDLNSRVFGYLSTPNTVLSVELPLNDVTIEGTLCIWTLPLQINATSISYDTTNRTYDLQLWEDGILLYTESGITLGGDKL